MGTKRNKTKRLAGVTPRPAGPAGGAGVPTHPRRRPASLHQQKSPAVGPALTSEQAKALFAASVPRHVCSAGHFSRAWEDKPQELCAVRTKSGPCKQPILHTLPKDPAARATLVEAHAPLVYKAVASHRIAPELREKAVAEAWAGLLEALEDGDPWHGGQEGGSYATYAFQKIRGRLHMLLTSVRTGGGLLPLREGQAGRKVDKAPEGGLETGDVERVAWGRGVQSYEGMSSMAQDRAEAALGSTEGLGAEAHLDPVNLEKLSALLGELTEEDRALVCGFWGVGGYKRQGIAELAKERGVQAPAISKRKDAILARLRKRLAEKAEILEGG